MLQRNRSIRRVKNGKVLDAKRSGMNAHAIAGFDRCLLCAKAPLRHLFFARGDLAVVDDDRRQINSLDAIGSEIHPRAVLGLIGIARRVYEEAGLGPVIPFGVTSGDALLITLVKNDVAIGDDYIGCVVDRDFVSLQTIR